MKDVDFVELASNFLTGKRIRHVLPGRVIARDEISVDVVFLVPEALDPDCIVDPPDVRVHISLKTLEPSFVDQM